MPTKDSSKQSSRAVAVGHKDDKEEAQEIIQLVVFELDKEEYAVSINDVREVLKVAEITPVPNSPDFISGIINLRGRVIAIIDLEKRFDLTREHADIISQHIVVSDVQDSPFGIIVDQVTEVLRIPKNLVQSTAAINRSKIGREYIKGVVVLKAEVKNEGGDSKEKLKSNERVKAKKQSSERILLLLDIKQILTKEARQAFKPGGVVGVVGVEGAEGVHISAVPASNSKGGQGAEQVKK